MHKYKHIKKVQQVASYIYHHTCLIVSNRKIKVITFLHFFKSKQVQRNETFGKFEVLVRRCATSCLPHCGIWGDDIDTERCYSCCTTDLCNTDNSANKRPVLSVTFNMINIFLLLYMYSNTFS